MKNKAQHIEIIKIDDIKPHPKNNNMHGSDQIDRLVKIINYQGFRDPLIISKQTNLLICGHGRLQAAKLMGMTELPCIKQDFENEAMEYAHMTADNEIARWADLDVGQLLKDLETIEIPDLDVLGLVSEKLPTVTAGDIGKPAFNEPIFYIVLPFDNIIDQNDMVEELEIKGVKHKVIENKTHLKQILKMFKDKAQGLNKGEEDAK